MNKKTRFQNRLWERLVSCKGLFAEYQIKTTFAVNKQKKHFDNYSLQSFMHKLLLPLLFLATLGASAQIPKYGNVKAEEISDMSNPVDPEAEAVFLYRNCRSSFGINTEGDFVLETQMRARIKILKEEGKDWATITVPIYYNKGTTSRNDQILRIEAAAYNLENGKIVKTKMQDKYIVKEQTSDYRRTIKFTIPDVKVGTVIEYKYTIISPRYYRIPTWYSQLSIPVLKSHCDITYDEDYQFSVEAKGYEQQSVTRKPTNISYSYKGKHYSSNGIELNIDAENMPAIKDEGLVYNTKIYASRVEFELRLVNIPGYLYQDLSSDWGQVKKNLGEEHYDKCLKIKNPFKAEMDTMNLSSLKIVDRASAIFKLLKNKLKWNETYALWDDNPLNALKDGKGDNAQLNFILISMLKDAGISCTPILLKFRSGGPLPLTYATMDQLDTFAVAFCDESGNVFFLESSADYGGINVIPENMLNDAILYDSKAIPNSLARYNLAKIAGHQTTTTIQATVSEDGSIQGSIRNVMQGLNAMNFNKKYHTANDSAEFVAKKGERDEYDITSYSVRDVDGSNVRVMESIFFKKDLMTNDDRIYVNPIVFPDEHGNYFTSEVRKYPVEFPYLQKNTVAAQIVIPQNYEIEEIPQNARYTFNNGDINVSISLKVQGNTISTVYKSELNTVLVLPPNYQELREFWSHLLELNSLNIVLKKK